MTRVRAPVEDVTRIERVPRTSDQFVALADAPVNNVYVRQLPGDADTQDTSARQVRGVCYSSVRPCAFPKAQMVTHLFLFFGLSPQQSAAPCQRISRIPARHLSVRV